MRRADTESPAGSKSMAEPALTQKISRAARNALRSPVRKAARSMGYEVLPVRAPLTAESAAFESLHGVRNALAQVVDASERRFLERCAELAGHSRAQNFQDVFALHALRQKSAGFFVEFGSTDGVNLSNTHMLEKKFGWKGILAEPARCWTGDLKANRDCAIDLRCVWTRTGERLLFTETAHAELSTIASFAEHDWHSRLDASREYEVETISLSDLLREHEAPRRIDYLSIDTEGSEYPILSHFDYDEFEIGVFTVEHNYVEPERGQIYSLLTSKGYRRMFEKFSGWDDWYVLDSLT
jgi:FkbM family methyltransferase